MHYALVVRGRLLGILSVVVAAAALATLAARATAAPARSAALPEGAALVPAAPVAVPEEAVPALADLLLAALGRDRRVPAEGGGDDQQDHR